MDQLIKPTELVWGKQIVETFEPCSMLPIKVTEKGMLLLEKFSELKRTEKSLFLELGTGRVNTAKNVIEACDAICPSLITKAINQECEFIQFFI